MTWYKESLWWYMGFMSAFLGQVRLFIKLPPLWRERGGRISKERLVQAFYLTHFYGWDSLENYRILILIWYGHRPTFKLLKSKEKCLLFFFFYLWICWATSLAVVHPWDSESKCRNTQLSARRQTHTTDECPSVEI